MNCERIGDAAGIVWNELGEKGKVTLSELKKIRVGFTSDEVIAAVGWLAREGKIAFQSKGRVSYLSLVEEESYI